MEEGLCLGKGGEVGVDCVVGVGLGVGLEEVLCGAAWERVGVVLGEGRCGERGTLLLGKDSVCGGVEGLCCWGRTVWWVRIFVDGKGQCGG